MGSQKRSGCVFRSFHTRGSSYSSAGRRPISVIIYTFILFFVALASSSAAENSADAILESVYVDYMIVKSCFDMDYIDQSNLDMARTAVRAKQDHLNPRDQLDTEAIWGAADKSIGGMLQMIRMGSSQYNRSVENFCSDAFARVASPTNGFKPGRMKKDF